MTDFSKGSAFVNGEIVSLSEAKISLLDWGFLHSDATYDVVHVWDGKFFRLQDHLHRFFNSMEKLHLSIPYTQEQLTTILVNCVQSSGLYRAYVEMITTRGFPQPGSRDPRTCSNQFFAFVIPFVWLAKPEKGLHLIISSKERIPPTSVDPVVKNYHWLDMVMGLYEAYEKGGETAALVDSQGNILEGPGFNIFAIKNSVIKTPASGILEGITRKTTIELAKKYGYQVIEGDLTPDFIQQADEAFVTSTAGGIIPIIKVDNRQLSNGKIGLMTKIFYDAYWSMHHEPQYSYKIDY